MSATVTVGAILGCVVLSVLTAIEAHHWKRRAEAAEQDAVTWHQLSDRWEATAERAQSISDRYKRLIYQLAPDMPRVDNHEEIAE